MENMTFDFTSQQLADKVIEVADSYPEHVYKLSSKDRNPRILHCAYFDIGQDGNYAAGCIVGHALHRLGVTLEDIKEFNLSTEVTELLYLFMPPERRDPASDIFLLNVQRKQDEGRAWKECVKSSQ